MKLSVITGGGTAVNRWTTKTGVLGASLVPCWLKCSSAAVSSQEKKKKKIINIILSLSSRTTCKMRVIQINEPQQARAKSLIIQQPQFPILQDRHACISRLVCTLVPLYIFSLPCFSAPACACVVSVYSGQADSS